MSERISVQAPAMASRRLGKPVVGGGTGRWVPRRPTAPPPRRAWYPLPRLGCTSEWSGGRQIQILGSGAGAREVRGGRGQKDAGAVVQGQGGGAFWEGIA
uniref:Uncharacterized protein n=1 Tax=Arundo donax TaxID=35708 RepID=A0A0A8YTV0_ARUDO